MAQGVSEVCGSAVDYFMKVMKTSRAAGAEARVANYIASGAIQRKPIAQLFVDGAAETAVSGLLSGTGTALVQFISGGIQAALMPLVRATQGVVTADTKVMREGAAMMLGAVQGLQDFMTFARKGWSKGMPLDIDVSDPKTMGMSAREHKDFLAKIGLTPDSPPEKIIEAMGDRYDYMNKAIPGITGEVIRVPTRVIVAIDEGMKAIFRRQKYNAFAFRKAMEDTNDGKSGSVYDEFMNLLNVKLSDPEEGMKAWKNVKGKDDTSIGDYSTYFEAMDYAKMNAFQQQLFGIARQAQKARAQYKPLVFAIPFLKTPYNILKEGLTFVPGVGAVTGKVYRKAKSVITEEDLELGVTAAYKKMDNSEIAARQLLGVGASILVMQMVEEKMITGKLPDDPSEREAWRAAGIPEFSIKVGDTWISYRKFEPIATVFGLAADASRLMDDYMDNAQDPTVEEMEKLLGGVYSSMSENIMGKSFMEGLNTVVSLVSGAGGVAGGGGIRELEAFASNMGRIVIPYGAMLNNIARSMDTENAPDGKAWDRQATSVIEKLQQRLPNAPGLPTMREALPLMYGIYGGPRTLNIWDIWTGIKTVDEADRTALQQELGALSVAYAPVDRSFVANMRLTNDELAQLRQISAETITPYLEDLVFSDVFQQEKRESLKNRYFDNAMRLGRTEARKLFLAKNMSNLEFQKRYINAKRKSKGLQDIEGFVE